MSQIWGSVPAWYFWLEHAPGVYQLEMIHAENDPDDSKDKYSAEFRVKCYPYADQNLTVFSFLERTLISDGFFDHTNTPKFEFLKNIPEDLFTVATISVDMDSNGRSAVFCFESMEHLKTIYDRESFQLFDLIDQEHLFKKGEVDRNIPGLKIGYRFFDCLLSLFANTHKIPPREITCIQTDGYEILINGSDIKAVKTDSFSGYALNVSFLKIDSSILNSNPMNGNMTEPSEDRCVYQKFFDCGHFHENETENGIPFKFNPQWWSLAHSHYKSELASTCGCH